MRCAQARKRLLAYHDGDLSAQEQKRLQAHLSQCSPCQREWTLYQRALAALEEPLPLEDPGDLWPSFKARQQRGGLRRWGWVPATLAGVVVVFCVGMGFGLLRRSGVPEPHSSARVSSPEGTDNAHLSPTRRETLTSEIKEETTVLSRVPAGPFSLSLPGGTENLSQTGSRTGPEGEESISGGSPSAPLRVEKKKPKNRRREPAPRPRWKVPEAEVVMASLAPDRKAAPRMLLVGPEAKVRTGYFLAKSALIRVPSFWLR